MHEDTKDLIRLHLGFLREHLIDHGVSMAVDKETGNILFFDTSIYLRTGKFDGFTVALKDLVSRDSDVEGQSQGGVEG